MVGFKNVLGLLICSYDHARDSCASPKGWDGSDGLGVAFIETGLTHLPLFCGREKAEELEAADPDGNLNFKCTVMLLGNTRTHKSLLFSPSTISGSTSLTFSFCQSQE